MVLKSNVLFSPEMSVIISFNSLNSNTNLESLLNEQFRAINDCELGVLKKDLVILVCNCILNKTLLRPEVSSLGGGWEVNMECDMALQQCHSL